ncbi:MAG: cysteine synthase family protein [Bacteroidota bacterium]|nr:cysteine synthase family protein [Bacteroidota bacterium]
MVELHSIVEPFQGTVYAKLDGYNPGNSTKDRIALYIIEQAEREGRLRPGGTIVETTSGNTGYSLAMVGILKGYKCILAVTDKTSKDKIDYLKTLGAEVYVCPANVPPDHPDSYYSRGRQLAEANPNALYVNQYFNTLNIEAHFNSTGPEIWEQTSGLITHFVACSGTGGTISGTARFLKEQNPNIEVIGVDAYGSVLKTYHETGHIDKNDIFPYRIEGVGKNMIPDATDFSVIDRFVKVDDEESALMTREIARKEAIMAGYSSGAALAGLLKIKGELPKNSVVVVMFPDHGSRYMKKVFSDAWMTKQGFQTERNGEHVNLTGSH